VQKLNEGFLKPNSIKNKNLVRLLIILVSSAILFFIPSISHQIDNVVKSTLVNVRSTIHPDSNIVIISITQNDIEQLGGWPLRRNIYALLINKLSLLRVKRIGIEVFLSSTNSMQDIYDDLLIDEIKKSGNVVLSSILVKNVHGKDSLIFPRPKILFPKIKTGHINYLAGNQIVIPETIWMSEIPEYCFATEVAAVKLGEENLYVNIFSSWLDFKIISSLEFMKLAEENNSNLEYLKNKYVLVGISDPSLAKSIKTSYDSELPGIGLHAFALDNILNRRTIKREYSVPITLVMILLLALLFFPKSKIDFTYRYLLQLVGYCLIAIIVINLFYIEIYHSYWFCPLLFLFTSEFIFIFLEKREELSISFDENTHLKNLLHTKETKLAELENKAQQSEYSENDDLMNKIEILKSEINKLKKSEEIEEALNIDSTEVKEFQGIVFKSDKIKKIVSLIEKMAPHDATVIIQGESGTGKELIARAIHDLSKRKGKNFIALNCAAIPESLLESELFGYVKGAFTNAMGDKKGKFELADGGTLFLDEITETSEAFQTKLLRVIQFGEFFKVGSTQTQKVDVRIVTATNKNIEKAVKDNRFREDLFYRLNVLKIEVPPLRERREEISILAQYFSRREDPKTELSRIVMDSLVKNEWKGNVRELESVITHALIMVKAENRNLIKLSDLPEEYRKYEKSELEMMILESIRAKAFSHSSMNETAKELGGLSRTMVSESLRGIFLKTFVECNFDFEKTVKTISRNGADPVNRKVSDKLDIYLENIESGLNRLQEKEFTKIKRELASKYKNLPVKYHEYLDSIIQFKMKSVKN
jgi:two-component system, NtrC family, response regulator AtoC